MGKILKLPPLKNPLVGRKVKAVFYDYHVSENCCNDDSYRQVCVKCEKCGRKFVNGVLQKGGAE